MGEQLRFAFANGPGVLATGFLIEEDAQAGDSANINLLDD
jgi:hypothetical protein